MSQADAEKIEDADYRFLHPLLDWTAGKCSLIHKTIRIKAKLKSSSEFLTPDTIKSVFPRVTTSEVFPKWSAKVRLTMHAASISEVQKFAGAYS